MKIHTVFITHNRLELTKQAMASYYNTTSPESQFGWTVTVVDNGSTDGTAEWLTSASLTAEVFLLGENRYPGFATNVGWSKAPEDATHLQRADNDFIFLPGWCEEVERMFFENPKLGQLGMRTDEQELHNLHNVGGNCVISREIWDLGLRYDERPWPKIKTVGFTEDSFMSPQVTRMGYEWDRVEKLCILPCDEDFSDDYYTKTYLDRGILPPSMREHA